MACSRLGCAVGWVFSAPECLLSEGLANLGFRFADQTYSYKKEL